MNNRAAIRNFVRYYLIITVTVLASCSDKRLTKYENIIQEADRFEIVYYLSGYKINLQNHLIPRFKEVLIRNIKPEVQRKLVDNVRIDIYKNNRRTAFMVISYDSINPFVNFNSNSLNFGFHLTYGIGQYIDNIYAAKNH